MTEPSEFELSLPARSENLKTVRNALSDFAASLGAPDEMISDLRLAVNEACSNVVRHAYGGRSGEMRVEARQCGTSLLVLVRDSGFGLSRASENPGTGLGLRVASAVSSSFAMEQTNEGTQVRLVFPLE